MLNDNGDHHPRAKYDHARQYRILHHSSDSRIFMCKKATSNVVNKALELNFLIFEHSNENEYMGI